MIERIIIDNFKSLRHVDLALGTFNLFIGTNASGKSNFFDYDFWNLWVFIPDADRSTPEAMTALEGELASKNITLLCSPAQPEVEAMHVLPTARRSREAGVPRGLIENEGRGIRPIA